MEGRPKKQSSTNECILGWSVLWLCPAVGLLPLYSWAVFALWSGSKLATHGSSSQVNKTSSFPRYQCKDADLRKTYKLQLCIKHISNPVASATNRSEIAAGSILIRTPIHQPALGLIPNSVADVGQNQPGEFNKHPSRFRIPAGRMGSWV